MYMRNKRAQKEHNEHLIKQFNELKEIYFLKCNEIAQIEQSIKDYEEHFRSVAGTQSTNIYPRIKLKNTKITSYKLKIN